MLEPLTGLTLERIAGFVFWPLAWAMGASRSEPGTPAVLCLVITREGTSITIIENRPDPLHPDGWGQRLYFNHAGQRTLFTAERRSDVPRRVEANLGSSSTRARSICSSSRSSSSESGTVSLRTSIV